MGFKSCVIALHTVDVPHRGDAGRALDLWFTGRGFVSWLGTIALWPWASCLHLCASVTKQYNLVPAKGGDIFDGESNCGPGGQ